MGEYIVKDVENDDRLLGRVGCGHGFVNVHVLIAAKHFRRRSDHQRDWFQNL